MPDAAGWLPDVLEPGDYGRATHRITQGRPSGWWQVCSPTGDHGSLSPAIHQVIEHEDGTITVSPSIDFRRTDHPDRYHGWLKRGEWT